MVFFHGIPLEGDRYDMNKDVMDGKLLPVDEDEEDDAENVEGQGNNLGVVRVEAEPSL